MQHARSTNDYWEKFLSAYALERVVFKIKFDKKILHEKSLDLQWYIKTNSMLFIFCRLFFPFRTLFAQTTTTVYNFHLKLPIKYTLLISYAHSTLRLLTHSLPHIFKWIWTESEKKSTHTQQIDDSSSSSSSNRKKNTPRKTNRIETTRWRRFYFYICVLVNKLRRTTLLMENCWNSTSTANIRI